MRENAEGCEYGRGIKVGEGGEGGEGGIYQGCGDGKRKERKVWNIWRHKHHQNNASVPLSKLHRK